MIAMITTRTGARKAGVMLIMTASCAATRPASVTGNPIGATAVATGTASTTQMATPATWGRRVNTRRDIAKGIAKATSAPIATITTGDATIAIMMATTTAIAIGATVRTTAAG